MATDLRTTRSMSGPKFTATRAETLILSKIAARAVALAAASGVTYKHQDAWMDLEAAHSNGCPLKLAELLAADDGTFGHDVFGIRRFIDRETGLVGGCFLPRLAQPEAARNLSPDLVGYSNDRTGRLYLIGIGPREWLEHRLHAGCTELVTREPTEADLREPASIERDLSGGSLR